MIDYCGACGGTGYDLLSPLVFAPPCPECFGTCVNAERPDRRDLINIEIQERFGVSLVRNVVAHGEGSTGIWVDDA